MIIHFPLNANRSEKTFHIILHLDKNTITDTDRKAALGEFFVPRHF